MDSIRKISWNDGFWFFLAETATYLIFFLIALIFYIPLFWIWTTYTLDLAWILYLVFFTLYPLFYICLSVTSMLAVLPLDSITRVLKLRYFANIYSIAKMYIFYAIRLSLEGLLFIVIPFIVLSIWNNLVIATISASLGLVLPLALLRGSAYELKLEILAQDSQIKEIFASHYLEKNG